MTTGASRGSILVVDDDDDFRRILAGELARRGYVVTSAARGEAAVTEAMRSPPDVILLDLRLPDVDGIEVLARLRELETPAGVIVLTGNGTIDTAIQAIRKGAYDYLEKPCPMEKVELSIQKAREHLRLVARQRVLQDGYSPPDVRSAFVGAGPAFRRLRESVTRVARADATTLVTGETGAGKELVTKLLHAESPRRDAPFVVVDCASLDEELLRSELFGHEKGAFTGAARQKHGLFEVANGGTLFLDEVGDATPEIQAKLLRVLETGRFRRLGGNEEIAVDVRIVSATNRDLPAAVTRGRFRGDLFFRLSTLTIHVPPLRERAEDIPLLVEHYALRLGRRLDRAVRFSDAAVAELVRHPWPGNVRELVHVLEQTMVLADHDVIEPKDLPASVRAHAPAHASAAAAAVAAVAPGLASAAGPPPPLHEIERRHVLGVVESTGGNRAHAARILAISERHLYRLLEKYAREAAGETPREPEPPTEEV